MTAPALAAHNRRQRAHIAVGVVLALLAVAVIWWAGREGGVLAGVAPDEQQDDPTLGWAEVDAPVRSDLLASAEVVNGEVPAELPRVVLLNLWASYCGPCREEMPALSGLDEADPDVTVLGISLDKDRSWARDFQQEVGASFANVLDPASYLQEELSEVAPVRWLPTTFLIVDGRARWVHLGPFDDLEALRRDVRGRLAEINRA